MAFCVGTRQHRKSCTPSPPPGTALPLCPVLVPSSLAHVIQSPSPGQKQRPLGHASVQRCKSSSVDLGDRPVQTLEAWGCLGGSSRMSGFQSEVQKGEWCGLREGTSPCPAAASSRSGQEVSVVPSKAQTQGTATLPTSEVSCICVHMYTDAELQGAGNFVSSTPAK